MAQAGTTGQTIAPAGRMGRAECLFCCEPPGSAPGRLVIMEPTLTWSGYAPHQQGLLLYYQVKPLPRRVRASRCISSCTQRQEVAALAEICVPGPHGLGRATDRLGAEQSRYPVSPLSLPLRLAWGREILGRVRRGQGHSKSAGRWTQFPSSSQDSVSLDSRLLSPDLQP